jgi:alkylresorcinol/alkylpyrone synthase
MSPNAWPDQDHPWKSRHVSLPSTARFSITHCPILSASPHLSWMFGVVLSPELPVLLRKALRPAVDVFLQRHDLALEGFRGFLLHPGGRKVLETAEDVLQIDRDLVAHSWAVLRDYGNMFSVTSMFVLDRAVRAADEGPHLLAAFGPGFSAYFIALTL